MTKLFHATRAKLAKQNRTAKHTKKLGRRVVEVEKKDHMQINMCSNAPENGIVGSMSC